MADNNNTSHLPPEIIEIIMSKLSVNSLLRFKAVSKSWNTMISDPIFVQNYLHKSKYSNSRNLLLCKSPSSNYSEVFNMFELEEEDRKLKRVRVLKGSSNTMTQVVCSCDGVLLLADRSYTTLGLWNPSTRAQARFPSPKIFKYELLSYGLCRDPTAGGDFKVVIAWSDFYKFFSCKNKTWSRRKKYGDGSRRFGSGSKLGVCVDGVVYWVMTDKIGYRREIVYFDPRDDKLEILQKPENIVDDYYKRIYLTELRGCLCLYCHGGDKTRVQIWTKGKKGSDDSNSWKELITIENVKTPISLFRPMLFIEENILIWINSSSSSSNLKNSCTLVLYCPYEMKFERVEGEGLYGVELVPYMDSLLFPMHNTAPKRKRKKRN
ncbi:hypothetical protein ACP275_14G072800 [Erythranthe tilingii]